MYNIDENVEMINVSAVEVHKAPLKYTFSLFDVNDLSLSMK
jgi:hypothetical protein